ncbi:alpha/beta hydrolase family protein [Pseudaestuariivita rosea]|uniref:alpha/beta hydrolase family protein n=1 Tax=Pseudaestuariivita rosea TaxID=2763263 RepID=UPI001ABA63AF|nr:alpha/beta fold hydrolase [Pseudaestuariivita rosea]
MRKLLLTVAVTLAGTAAQAQDFAGYDQLTIDAEHRTRPIAGSIWYPVGTPTYRGLIGDNAVFQGTSAYVGAAVKEGSYPLVLLSHGSGGNMDGLGWLSSELANRGIMVLAVNHPGSTSGDSSPRRSILLDDRAADISEALDHILADPTFGPKIDQSRIVSVGFSLGGTTVLTLAGARLERDLYRDYCARLPDAEDCVFFKKGGVDFDNLPESWTNDMSDPRLTAAIAVDPGMTYAIAPQTAATMTLPIMVLSLGGPGLLWKATDVGPTGSNLMANLPNGTRQTVTQANHFSFLGLCKPEGAAILVEEKDDPVCNDPAGSDRSNAHKQAIEKITGFILN